MNYIEANDIGQALATARLAERVADQVDLRWIGSFKSAVAVQSDAATAFGGQIIGWTIAASSEATRRLLRCDGPVVGPIFSETKLRSGELLRVSPTMVGIGAQFAFVFGRSFPQSAGEPVSLQRMIDAIVSCHISLQVIGRRLPPTTPLNEWTATADFGLSDTYVEGEPVQSWTSRLSPARPVALRVDGHIHSEGSSQDVMGGPLAPALWLCRHLRSRRACVEAGDVVATGSCTGLVQMLPGHLVTADFGDLGSVDLRLS